MRPRALGTPETLKNLFSVCGGHPMAVIHHAKRAVGMRPNDNLTLRRRINNRILNQVSEGVSDRMNVSLHLHGTAGRDKSKRAFLCQRPRRHTRYDPRSSLVQI